MPTTWSGLSTALFEQHCFLYLALEPIIEGVMCVSRMCCVLVTLCEHRSTIKWRHTCVKDVTVARTIFWAVTALQSLSALSTTKYLSKRRPLLIILILGVVGRSALRYVLRVSRGLQIAAFHSAATGSFRRHNVFSAFEHSSSAIFRNRVFLVLQMPLVIVLQRAPRVE